ncbi:partner of Y14 and mago [Orussus abietinus]|uniref:partner of Y14 and mago n=1 Tax=Orussus abietinus TaxID=222816 RepID=UPI0006256501|nr:partner of Y14 and mago [Orussus abietinus]
MASAYIKDEQGGTFIPATQRPDGTWRKPRRVKDGYVPQEEVPLYESKGKQFIKNKPIYPPGMSVEYAEARKAEIEAQARAKSANPIPGLVIQTESKKKKKKSKNKTVNAITDGLQKTRITEPVFEKQKSASSAATSVASSTTGTVTNTMVDPTKRLKNLNKKIREIETLEQKIKTGDIKNPEQEMLNKLSRKSEILLEIRRISIAADIKV